jgi:hypothetical protein
MGQNVGFGGSFDSIADVMRRAISSMDDAKQSSSLRKSDQGLSHSSKARACDARSKPDAGHPRQTTL